jgi:A circularly permuted ATPgrasp
VVALERFLAEVYAPGETTRDRVGPRPLAVTSVHAVYRGVDDEDLDLLHFLAGSMLGSAGLVNAARAGNVAITNSGGRGLVNGPHAEPSRHADARQQQQRQ